LLTPGDDYLLVCALQEDFGLYIADVGVHGAGKLRRRLGHRTPDMKAHEWCLVLRKMQGRLSCVGREHSNGRSTKNSAAAAADCVGTDGFD
jgi:hypothetical protein